MARHRSAFRVSITDVAWASCVAARSAASCRPSTRAPSSWIWVAWVAKADCSGASADVWKCHHMPVGWHKLSQVTRFVRSAGVGARGVPRGAGACSAARGTVADAERRAGQAGQWQPLPPACPQLVLWWFYLHPARNPPPISPCGGFRVVGGLWRGGPFARGRGSRRCWRAVRCPATLAPTRRGTSARTGLGHPRVVRTWRGAEKTTGRWDR